jgi:hypothetical protein
MTVEPIEVDSYVFGRNVLSIRDFDPESDFAAFERDYLDRYDPAYVSCKIPMERVDDVHRLEDAGFHLMECQIRARIKLRKPYDTMAFPYDFERVTREKDLDEVLAIAGTTFEHDRFRNDSRIAPHLAGLRYQEYVRKSFRSSNEAVYRLIDRKSGSTVAFKTHLYVSEREVLFLLGGVREDLKNLGLGMINEYFEFNELIGKGVTSGVTHISAANYPIFNLELCQLGFRVTTTFAVMRKLYGVPAPERVQQQAGALSLVG